MNPAEYYGTKLREPVKRDKSLRTWIRENRKEIDKSILTACPNAGKLNDDERRLWILNDEGLYLWARRDGINI